MTTHWAALRAERAAGPGDVASARGVSAAVAQSWRRCLAAKLDPMRDPEEPVLEARDLAIAREACAVLRRIARPELDLLFRQMSGSNYVVALGSPDGALTDVLADPSFADTAVGKVVVEGSVWTETIRGTNAMGLCLHDQAPRSVWRGEHFFHSHDHVSCLAAPVFDGEGRIAGVVDASTGSEEWHEHTMALLTLSATNIEAGLFRHDHTERRILSFHPRAEYIATVSAGLIALDADGRIAAITRRGRDILGQGPEPRGAALADLFDGAFAATALRMTAGDTATARRRAGGGLVFGCVHAGRRPAPGRAGACDAARGASARARRFDPPQAPFVAEDAALKAQMALLARAAPAGAPVHLTGESGVGKELMARHVHALSGRRGSFVPVNCAAIPADLFVAEIFGHAAGAYTGAAASGADGLAVAADGGVLFLDEVADIPAAAQAALLRFLDDGEVRRVGGRDRSKVNVQIVSATNRDLAEEVRAGRFRLDLLYRLNAVTIRLPPLRERTDFEEIVRAVLSEVSPGVAADRTLIKALRAHCWPGNIRELRNVLRLAVLCAGTETLDASAMTGILAAEPPVASDRAPVDSGACRRCAPRPIRARRCAELRRVYLRERNATAAARNLGVARSTLYQHIHDLIADARP